MYLYLETWLLMGFLFVSDIIIILDFPGVISKTVKVKVIALLQGIKFVEETEKQEGADDGDNELRPLHNHSAAPCFQLSLFTVRKRKEGLSSGPP